MADERANGTTTGSASSADTHAPSRPDQWLDRYGDVLFRYALSRVQTRELAEELVQETFAAALRGRDQFAGRSSEQTWMIGILRRKIVDQIRRQNRDRTLDEPDATAELLSKTFDHRGRWKARLPDWPANPARTLEQQEFWDVFDECVSNLPGSLKATYCLHELERLSREEVCKVLDLSASNLWTQLHRARMLLRRCLELNWFTHEERA